MEKSCFHGCLIVDQRRHWCSLLSSANIYWAFTNQVPGVHLSALGVCLVPGLLPCCFQTSKEVTTQSHITTGMCINFSEIFPYLVKTITGSRDFFFDKNKFQLKWLDTFKLFDMTFYPTNRIRSLNICFFL